MDHGDLATKNKDQIHAFVELMAHVLIGGGRVEVNATKKKTSGSDIFQEKLKQSEAIKCAWKRALDQAVKDSPSKEVALS